MRDGEQIAVRTLIQASVVAAVALAVLLLLYAAQIFLVIFAGVLLAVLFHSISTWIRDKTGLPEKLSIAIALIAPFLAAGIFIWLIAPDVSNQASELADRIPRAASDLEQRLLQHKWASWIMGQQQQIQDALPSASRAFELARTFFSTTLGALGNLWSSPHFNRTSCFS